MTARAHIMEWEDRFRELEAFHEQFGHCRVPKHAVGLQGLVNWVAKQISEIWDLPLDQLQRLYDLGFPFRFHDRRWLLRFFELVDFKKAHGHCIVPWAWPDNPTLNTWSGTQRCWRNKLLPGRRRRLEEIGFVWDLFDWRWNECFERLKAFYAARGAAGLSRREHCLVIGWASHQRSRRRELPPDQIEKLNSIGFDWEPFNTLWRKHFKALKAFKKRFGHCYVQRSWPDPPFLGVWVQELRLKKDRLSPERIAELDGIGFAWDFREFAGLGEIPLAEHERVNYVDGLWTKRFLELKAFKEEHGHCRVPAGWPDNRTLATWVVRQRSSQKKLAEDRRQRLEDLGFAWEPWEEHSIRMLEQLTLFKRERGHCNVPSRYPENQPLADWVQRQRERYHGNTKHAPLPAALRQTLEDMEFTWRLKEARPGSGRPGRGSATAGKHDAVS